MKELIIGGIILITAIIIATAIIMKTLNGNATPESTKSQTTNTANSTGTQATSESKANSKDSPISMNNAPTAPTYNPGVYTASVSLEGNPVDIQVTVDKHNINSIELVHISDAVTTMYPLIETNFESIAQSVMEQGSTKNITLGSDNKYTSSMLLNAIQNALNKCTTQE